MVWPWILYLYVMDKYWLLQFALIRFDFLQFWKRILSLLLKFSKISYTNLKLNTLHKWKRRLAFYLNLNLYTFIYYRLRLFFIFKTLYDFFPFSEILVIIFFYEFLYDECHFVVHKFNWLKYCFFLNKKFTLRRMSEWLGCRTCSKTSCSVSQLHLT